jgi:DNA polymerase-3 subunit alpha
MLRAASHIVAYTMLEGAIDPKAIVSRAKALGFPAAPSPIATACTARCPSAMPPRKRRPADHRHLARGGKRPGTAEGNRQRRSTGWRSMRRTNAAMTICARSSRPRISTGRRMRMRMSHRLSRGRTDGLIALTGGGEGALARLLADEQKPMRRALSRSLQAFSERLYIELSRRGDDRGSGREALIDLAYARDLPLVATNPAAYAEPDFHAAHDVMLCIAVRPIWNRTIARIRRRRLGSSRPTRWRIVRRSARGDREYAGGGAALRSRGAARKPILPSLAGDREAEAALLRKDARAGPRSAARAAEMTERRAHAYFERLDFETNVIVSMGFPGYFLIVADFIKWAKEQGIPVGPGRGSGAGSVVAWSLTITDLDPLELGLLFERFLNPGTRVDARFRHRFLRNAARRGDPATSSRNMAAIRSRRSSPSGG